MSRTPWEDEMSKRSYVLTFIVLLFLALSLSSADLDRDVQRGFDSIRAMDAYSYVRTMVEPRFAERHTRHEGYTAAARWAAGKFKQWGLKPIDKASGYLQPFPRPYVMVDQAEMTLLSGNNDKETALKPETDFLPLLATDSGDHTASLVFVGWGVSAPDLGYDDYAGVDVRGKFVFCFRGLPDRRDDRFRPHDEHRHRMRTAQEKGALGLFYIYADPIANPNMDLIPGFTNAIISEKTADRILSEIHVKSADLRSDLQAYKRPISFSLESRMRYRVSSRHFPDGTGYNVVGWIEGTDPELKKECLVFGGHFDHCGEHIGILFPGANDNASGSAAVMEIAEAFSRMRRRPKRSLVFVLFGGEEMGLQGSSYFVENVPAPFTRVDAMFNFDMVGEGDGVGCSVSPEPAGLKQALQDSDIHVEALRRVRDLRGPGGGSDYAPFHGQGIPCISCASNGPHLHYHRSGDTIHRVNPDVMADTARLLFLTGWTWADR